MISNMFCSYRKPCLCLTWYLALWTCQQTVGTMTTSFLYPFPFFSLLTDVCLSATYINKAVFWIFFSAVFKVENMLKLCLAA